MDADGKTCGERIDFLLQNHPKEYPTEMDACRQVAQVEFPHLCGSNCNPDSCDAPLTARTSLYCFPEFDERKRFRNVFGSYTAEVKESKTEPEEICGPQDNKFSTNTVERLGKNKIKLQFKKVGDKWEGSEIRLRLPDAQMPFHYGTYSFSVASIQVVHSETGEVQSRELPRSIILSMQTWDATENYAVHENFNHQVSIDISRFDNEAGPDGRFVVQPAIEFNSQPFYTGKDETYKQSPREYEFVWNPTKIDFYSNAGGSAGEKFTYSSKRAVRAGEPDFTQCLPADVEIRINLWNLYGTLPPTDMVGKEQHIVEVVIDDFSYAPSGLEYVPDGEVCSRDCHCSPSSMCFSNHCQPAVSSQYYKIDAWLAGTSEGSRKTQQSTARVILGLTIFGSCAVALVALLNRHFRKRDDEVHAASFKYSPSAVKG